MHHGNPNPNPNRNLYSNTQTNHLPSAQVQVDSFVDRSERIARQEELAALRTKLEAEREALKKEQPRGAPSKQLKARKNKNAADLTAVRSGEFPKERQTRLEAERLTDEEVAASALRNEPEPEPEPETEPETKPDSDLNPNPNLNPWRLCW